ncbi:Hypothetical protein SRAE_2000528100 [Strongyloides ratti]|uniref:C2H2-type domain-containing protein n=1 Tax=Strongyloides ratti TaxID=34506 RepID=A0A090LLQ7_STRRB|nr:Hypothetical protein SRAE_2000528100 [Strongyloides ratti]CEF70656.1 Hypothetical protein SRAE_2000528100 [Strongyloides ratti]
MLTIGKSFNCYFCLYTTNDPERCKEHEFYTHVVGVFFPPTPGIIPDYQIYPYREPTPEEEQITPCVIKECESIITGKNLTRHVMNRHCNDTPPFQCKYCFRFYNNHVSVLQHAVECNLGAIDKYFHSNELKLLNLCVNNKKAFNIYKECFDTYLKNDIKYNPQEYDKKSNDYISFPESTVGLTITLIQRLLNAFFKDKLIQRHQLEKTFLVTDRNNFDQMYNFFHCIASLFPEIFNSLVPIIECCENRYTNPTLCNCNKLIINNLPTNNKENNFLDLQISIPPFVQAPDGTYHYALNPNTFFINGTHKFFKIIDGINLDSDGVYGALLSSAIYADIFEFMKMNDENLNKQLINIGYDNYRDRWELINMIRKKCFFLINGRDPEEGEKMVLLNDTVFLPTCTFTDDSKAEFLKNWLEEVNTYYCIENSDMNFIKCINPMLPFLDNINYNNNFRNRYSEPTASSRLAIALKKVFSLYTSAPDEVVDDCLKKVDLTHIYFCVANEQESSYYDNYNYEMYDNNDEINIEMNVLSHRVQQIELNFFEPQNDNDDEKVEFDDKQMEIPSSDFDQYEILDKLMDALPDNGLLMDTFKESTNEAIENYDTLYTPEEDSIENTINSVDDLDSQNNYFDTDWDHTTKMNFEVSLDTVKNSKNVTFNENYSVDLSVNTITNHKANIQNQPMDLSINSSNQWMLIDPTNNHQSERNIDNQITNYENNSFLGHINILNSNVNSYHNLPANMRNINDIFFQNIFKIHEHVTRNLSDIGKGSKNNKILNKTIQKSNYRK